MSALGRFLRQCEDGKVAFRCPGCQSAHSITVAPGHWRYNGNPDAPTILPSVKIEGCLTIENADDGPSLYGVCHSNVTNGFIYFHGDTTHGLSGQSVPLPEFDQE